MATRRRMAVADIPDVSSLLLPEQLFALEMETKTAAYYLDVGLAALDEILDEKHDFYPAPLQLLGSGLEHLLKTTLAVGTLQVEGSLPSIGRIKKVVGHDLRALRDLVVLVSLTPPLGSSEVGEGLELGSRVLVSSSLMERLLAILSDYGARDRYYYLDELLESDQTRKDPVAAFRDWLHEDASEASWDLYEDEGDESVEILRGREFSPLLEHIIADRPAAFRRDRKHAIYLPLIGFIVVACMFCVFFRGDGEEGALAPFIRARTLLRPPTPWYVRRKRRASSRTRGPTS